MNTKAFLTIVFGLLYGPMVVSAATINLVAEGTIVGTTEDFESPSAPSPQSSLEIFGGAATMTGEGSIEYDAPFYVVSSWFIDTNTYAVTPASGSQFAAIGGDGYVDITFDSGVSAFGGYFADGITSTNTKFELFGVDNTTPLWSNVFSFNSTGSLIWAGLTSDTLIGRIRISGTETPMDKLVFATNVPAPVPLPAAAWLLLSGLAGLGFVGRRHTAK